MSQGFKVKIRGRTGLTYIEGSKVGKIDSELTLDPVGITIYMSRFRGWEGGGSPLPAEELEKIRKNIEADLGGKGYVIDWA